MTVMTSVLRYQSYLFLIHFVQCFAQHLVTTYGEYLLQVIQKLSKGLNLSLDGEAILQTNEVRKLSPIVTNKSTKLSTAKYDAWKMWHEDGLSIHQIAVSLTNFL